MKVEQESNMDAAQDPTRTLADVVVIVLNALGCGLSQGREPVVLPRHVLAAREQNSTAHIPPAFGFLSRHKLPLRSSYTTNIRLQSSRKPNQTLCA